MSGDLESRMPLPTLTRPMTPSVPRQTTTPPDEAPVKIDVEHLSFYYGSKLALSDISMQIRANLVTAFIGPSGCGEHVSADAQSDERHHPGRARRRARADRRPRRLRTRHRRRRAPAAGRNGVPALEPVPEIH